MHDERDWADIRPPRSSAIGEAGLGVLRITLLFGSLAIAIALFVAPVLDRGGTTRLAGSPFYSGLDRTATGSAGTIHQGSTQYTIRRSVLQTSPGAMCIVHSNGTRSGDC
ncbi:hypothetical protein [Oricola cellulosilytica]|uniref:Uncharacterized protein n=1 Tax=Oricola cellulosilytica TaxID=1429082 RepID=A0A4R0PEB3_9HYPH|nr:hypothetical protein [Oricola cellulosilytica]TCD13713.1 hypothetical protein E0D97_11420 [Oricola cellulosilytica]